MAAHCSEVVSAKGVVELDVARGVAYGVTHVARKMRCTMQVELTHAAEIALRTLGDDDRRHVHAWCDRLRDWEHDEAIRSRARRLDVPGLADVYVLTTTTDLRIFFTVGVDRIEVTDIAFQESLQAFAHALRGAKA
jgi:hypothetical protein